MLLIAVVSSEIELRSLESNSFQVARKLGFGPILVIPKGMNIKHSDYYRVIELPNFAQFGEVNMANACKQIVVDEFILHVDPDEFFSHRLLSDIHVHTKIMRDGDVGWIKFRYYFKNKPLRGTPWGGVRDFARIGKPAQFQQRTDVHQRLSGSVSNVETDEVVRHYWANSFREIESKHKRYLLQEGNSKARLYGRWTLRGSILRLLRVHLGILRRIRLGDGATGLVLSTIFSRYAIKAEREFRRWSANRA